MSWVEVTDFVHPAGWPDGMRGAVLARKHCELLEAGEILFFPGIPFELPQAHRQTLLSKKQSDLRFHKNVSYQPESDVIRGLSATSSTDEEQIRGIMRDYSAAVTQFVLRLLAPYAGKLKLDFASYRPVEEAGRQLSLHKRNDLLHVDAFPSRPTAGGRILRVFTNLNPIEPRVWITGEPFDKLAAQHALQAGLETTARRSESAFWKLVRQAAAMPRLLAGRPIAVRTPYDVFMHHFHNYLKEHRTYQAHSPRQLHKFPPGSTWLVYTDCVPHAALSGQFALEQTYIVDVAAMVTPQRAPLRVLERLCGKALAA